MLKWLTLIAVCGASFGAGLYYVDLASPSQSRVRDRSMRLADQAVSEAYAGRLRDAYIAAAMARQADSSLPGLELIIGQMLYNAGSPMAAAQSARTALERGQSSPAAALLLGLEAWSLRGSPGASARVRAEWLTAFWLKQSLNDSPATAAAHFFLAELERLSGKGSGLAMERALHRFSPWESAWILEAKMQIASAESRGVYNAGELRASTRLDDSPQAAAVRVLQREIYANSASDDASQGFSKAFTLPHRRLLLSDPALSRNGGPVTLSLKLP